MTSLPSQSVRIVRDIDCRIVQSLERVKLDINFARGRSNQRSRLYSLPSLNQRPTLPSRHAHFAGSSHLTMQNQNRAEKVPAFRTNGGQGQLLRAKSEELRRPKSPPSATFLERPSSPRAPTALTPPLRNRGPRFAASGGGEGISRRPEGGEEDFNAPRELASRIGSA